MDTLTTSSRPARRSAHPAADSRRSVPTLAAGALSALLGLTVLVGWHTHNLALLHVSPAFVAMAYNTGLCFLLSGLGLAASGLPPSRTARVFIQTCAAGAGATGLLTLAEYSFGVTLGLDELLMQSYTRSGATHPGRMAACAALCFTLTALALTVGQARMSARRTTLTAVCGSLVVMLGLIALSGYFTGTVRSYAWGQLTRMAVHTALGFLVLGVGLIALAWRDDRTAGRAARRRLPLFVGAGASAAALCLWQALAVEQGAQLAAIRRVEAQDAGMRVAALTRVQDALPVVALAGGLALAGLLAWSVALAQTARARADALRAAQEGLEARVAERTEELARANEALHGANVALHEMAGWQRGFLRDVLASVSEGKLRLCDSADGLPARRGALRGTPLHLDRETGLSELRCRTMEAAGAAGFSPERTADLVTAVNEAGMNAVVHAGAGTARIALDAEAWAVQVWVEDSGQGITMEDLPRATLEKGFTTAGTLGHGLKLMLQTTDRLWLLTGPTGTTVVLEQDRLVPPPLWMPR